jgi:hypothetical protein
VTADAIVALHTLQEVLPDADQELRSYLSYPLEETLASDAAMEVVDDDFGQVAQTAVQAYESGELQDALQDGPDGFKVRAAHAWALLPDFGIIWHAANVPRSRVKPVVQSAAEMAEGRRQGSEAQGQAIVHAHAHCAHGANVGT